MGNLCGTGQTPSYLNQLNVGLSSQASPLRNSLDQNRVSMVSGSPVVIGSPQAFRGSMVTHRSVELTELSPVRSEVRSSDVISGGLRASRTPLSTNSSSVAVKALFEKGGKPPKPVKETEINNFSSIFIKKKQKPKQSNDSNIENSPQENVRPNEVDLDASRAEPSQGFQQNSTPQVILFPEVEQDEKNSRDPPLNKKEVLRNLSSPSSHVEQSKSGSQMPSQSNALEAESALSKTSNLHIQNVHSHSQTQKPFSQSPGLPHSAASSGIQPRGSMGGPVQPSLENSFRDSEMNTPKELVRVLVFSPRSSSKREELSQIDTIVSHQPVKEHPPMSYSHHSGLQRPFFTPRRIVAESFFSRKTPVSPMGMTPALRSDSPRESLKKRDQSGSFLKPLNTLNMV